MVEIVEGPKLVSQDPKRFQAHKVMNLINLISVRQTECNFVIYLIEDARGWTDANTRVAI